MGMRTSDWIIASCVFDCTRVHKGVRPCLDPNHSAVFWGYLLSSVLGELQLTHDVMRYTLCS